MQFQDINQTYFSIRTVKSITSLRIGDSPWPTKPIKPTWLERLFGLKDSAVPPEHERRERFSLVIHGEINQRPFLEVLCYYKEDARDEDYQRLCDICGPSDEPFGPMWFTAKIWADFFVLSVEESQQKIDASPNIEAREFTRANGTTGKKYRFKPNK